MNDNEVKKLYNALVNKGYSTKDLGDEATFSSKMTDKNSRKELYDYVSSKGNFRIGDYDSYENRLSSSATPKTTEEQPATTAQPEAAAPVEQAETRWKPTEQEKIRMSAQTQNIINSSKRSMADLNEHMDNMQEYGLNLSSSTKKGKSKFNPESGKMEDTYITPAGNRYNNKTVADAESFHFRQAADMSVGGQLKKAHLKLQQLEDEQERRSGEIHKKWEEDTKKNTAPLGLILAADTYVPAQMSDKEKRAYAVAIRQTEELIKDLEEQKDRDNGVDVGFWRGFGRTTSDFRTWDLGMSDMLDVMTMTNADKLTDEGATEGEKKAHDEMLGAVYEKQQADEQYGGNADFWNRAGVMTGYMPSFMIDFALTGGGFKSINFLGKTGAKAATKVIGKDIIEDIATQGVKSFVKNNGVKGFGQAATNWTIKALGTSADDLLLRAPLMTNTIQLGKTSANIIDRKLGDVVVDDNGEYTFSNDKDWSDAVWQAEANSVIENYSEMFGAHLDPVMSLSNMSKLANTIGAKRFGGVLAKADAGALNGIMGATNKMFEKMGVSDYVGEVSEEYYGQLWRTMLNLDDAYQQNPDGTRTNLFETGQFHGDIWGGMALSMGLMGAGKHTLSATNYASMKHGVTKADTKVGELLGKDIWEPLRETLDLTTNENIGDIADIIVADQEFTNEEKAAVLEYMERSMNLRGFNLGTMRAEKNPDEQQANESYLDGYNASSPQEMNDAKNMYEYQRQQVEDIADDNMLTLIEQNPIEALSFVNSNEQWSEEERNTVLDYINAKQVYNGMIQRVRDDIDGRIDQSNAMIEARVNRKTGNIQGATMKQDDRKVYVINGQVTPYDDNTGIDPSKSDKSIIIRDATTGALEQVSPESILNVDENQNPDEQKMLSVQAIREQFAQEAANKIDGVASFNPGDTYSIVGDGEQQMQVQIVANEMGLVDNGDGTVNVSDGANVFPISKEIIQQQVDAENIGRVAEFEKQRAEEAILNEEAEQEANRPQYAMNDLISLRDENGNSVRGSITADADADGRYEVFTEDAINGQRVNLFSRDQLDDMLMEHNGQIVEQPVKDETSADDLDAIKEQPQVSAFERIPKDEKGNPLYEQAETSDIAWDAIVEQTEGDEIIAQTVADGMVADKEAALKKVEKAKAKGGETIAEKIASEKERKIAIDIAKEQVAIWKKIAQTASRRKQAIESERRRVIEEEAALRKSEEEKLRAEREESERLEREALNGVPDMLNDTPQDARARGYRRVNGHKIDRQEPLPSLQGKEVAVKFNTDNIAKGRVAVIEANQLQPSHIQGVRNPQHFIDEAQPKERNDEASILSAQKIAGNIRPEEITSSVTAYTGAPTVNTRGEAIQGNSRSDALKIMWSTQKDQAGKYKQYLIDHAKDFGLNTEDIDKMESPVLVNMVDVEDAEAISLGQYVAQDTESGGVERIKPKNAVQKMGTNMNSFSNILLKSADEDMSFSGLIDSNGPDVLKWMSQKGYITPTQYKSAFDTKGNLTPEAKNDLRAIMYQSVFQGASTRLEEMFTAMPSKAQKSILATAFRDYDSSKKDRMVDEIQNSIRAFNALSRDTAFASAKNWKEARMAVEGWKRQYQIDDVTGESYLPANNFTNFALHLATMYKGESQSFIQSTFNQLYDLIQGTQEESLFEQPDNTPRTLAQAITETLKLEYNGQQRSNVLVGDTTTSQRGQQGSNGTFAPGERIEDGNESADDSRGIESSSGQSETLGQKLEAAEQETETNPTEAQKEAGNYKKGHVQVGTFDITIENPKGSERSGTDANGKKWSIAMQNTYGYIRGTEGIDGDHIDVFLTNNIDEWNGRQVFVVDQYNEDGTFDEHKVMLGFNDAEEAQEAYLSNYSKGWDAGRKLVYSSVNIEDFEKWIDSSHRKTKAFAEYKGVKIEPIKAVKTKDDVIIVSDLFPKVDNSEKLGKEVNRQAVITDKNVKLSRINHEGGYSLRVENESGDFIEQSYDYDGGTISYPIYDLGVNGDQFKRFFKQDAKGLYINDLEIMLLLAENALSLSTQKEAAVAVSKKETTTFPNSDGYTVEPAKYTTKRGKVLDMQLVKFGRELSKEEQRNARELAKNLKGWYDREQGGFMMRSAEDAQQIIDAVMEDSGETLADAAPISLQDIQRTSAEVTPKKINVEGVFDSLNSKGEAKLNEHEERQDLLGNYGGVNDYALVANSEGKTYVRGEDSLKIKRYVPEQGIVDVLLDGKNHKMSIPELAEALRNGRWEEQTTTQAPKVETKNEGALGLVSDERMADLKERLHKKLGGQLNVGIDPEILAIGMELAAGHIDRGVKKFSDFAKVMVDDLGDVIRPYLKAFYNGARDLPEIMDNGLSAELTPYDEVRTFDVANFDKEQGDPFATAETIVAEQEKQKQAEDAKKNIINQRNNERRKDDEQTTTNTEAIVGEAEANISKAEAIASEPKRAGKEAVNKTVQDIDSSLDKVNEQLTLLGFYKADEVEKDFNEMYGYMKNAEKKALADAKGFAKAIANKLGLDGRKAEVRANIAPAGGEIYIHLPLNEDKALSVYLSFKPDKSDNLIADDTFMYRVDDYTMLSNKKGMPTYSTSDFGSNMWTSSKQPLEQTLKELLNFTKSYLKEVPKTNNDIQKVNDLSVGNTTSENQKNKGKKDVSLQQTVGDLFGGLFENETITENENKNGLRRNDEVRTEGLPTDGNRHERRLPNGTQRDGKSQSKGSQGLNGRRKESGESTDRTVRSGLSDSVTPSGRKNTNNNHSERGVNHAPTSVDARIDANIKAIEIAQQLIESGESATPEQMAELRKFSGWGGLGRAFNDNGYSARIQRLLGAESYQQAVMSANSAYYTPAYVVDTLWDIAEQMGFKGGNILEGSAGIGNVLGQIPTHLNERSDIHAIEIDGTSGGILSLLYPDAKVEIQGFEQTRIPNGSVDLAITNVPFVTGLRVNDTTGDKDLSKKFHNIHDFCIAKNVRKLREGGIGIFISSNGTLDNSKKLRDWITSEGGSDFVGAFRMNNKTFGGTGVTSDIIVIRKRVNGQKSANAIDVSSISGERMAEYDTGETRNVKGHQVPIVKQLAMDYNRYFIEHPENMAGEMRFAFEKGDTFRPTSKGLYSSQGKNQEQMLSDFAQSFKVEEFSDKTSVVESGVTEVMPGKKIGEVFVKDGKLYINSSASAQLLEVNNNKVKGHTKVECFNAYTAIKDALADVLSYQTENESDKELQPLLDKLNKSYDDFVKTYGNFNKNTAIAFLRNDVDFPNVFSLEKYEETGDKSGNRVQTFGKTDIFSQRVIEKEKEPNPTNVKDGIIASVFKFGRIDIPYIAEQLGKSAEAIKQEILESGLGFEDPATRQVELSYQYLSGNVREKLRQAQENNENGEYDSNIKALQDIIPMNIPGHLIDFTLGSSWIEPKLYEDFTKERTDIDVKFTAAGGSWYMSAPEWGLNKEKNRSMGVLSEMLHKTIMGHTLIEAAMQNKSVTVSQTRKLWDGTTETITDKDATQACAAKIDEIRGDFKEWARQKMQSDAEMSERMERVYNDTFNNYVPINVPDDFVPEYFGGASHKFKMRPHQSKSIVRGTMQPLLLAHEVGTGKTFTLISTAMEMRRLGTARKPMIVVQNATVGQFVASAKELYPNAKILTLEESDRSAEGRMNFYAKIRYNDWDMIVVPQSTFEFIPDSEERQMAFVQDKIEEKMLVLEQMKDADPNGKSIITRQAEKEIELLQEQLAGLSDEASKKRTASDEKKRAVSLQNAEVKALEMLDRRTDDVENFDDMGIDALLVDEAHEYKHLGFATAMQRGVKGVDPSYSKKSQGVYLKTQAVLENNNGRNVIFATGTPISNTAAEIWTFMRYLMPADTMKEYGIFYFDDFVRNFGNIQQMLEFTTSGKFKENNRFAGYVNLPELVRIWSGVSDTVLTKEAGGVSDKIPELEDGKAQDLYLPQTRALRSIMKFVKAQLEEYEKMSGKEKKANSHIPLTMYGIAKAAAVDSRLVDSQSEDDQNSKTNEAVRQTLRSLKDTNSYKGTIAIFADNYQNKHSGFNLYEDIRAKLIAGGVPPEEVIVMKSGMTVKKKLEIFDKVNRGEVRVVLGSTFTLGTGVNIQERLHTLIHLDAPNRPMDYTQRNGRILRQGNLHKVMGKPVRILRFGVEDSLDVTAYQRLKTKGAIADSIMNGKQMMVNSMSNRVLEEEEDVFGDTVAQLSGSEYAMLKNNAEKNVRKFESRKKQWEADQTYIHNAKPKLKGQITEAEQRIERENKRLQTVQKAFPNGTANEIIAGKQTFSTIEEMNDYIKSHNKGILDEVKKMKDSGVSMESQTRELTISFGGIPFQIKTVLSKEMNRGGGQLFAEVHRKMTYSCPDLELEGIPVHQSLLRNAIEDITENVITGKDFAENVESAERSIKHHLSELEQLQSREGKPFEYGKELEQAKSQYEEYIDLMKKEMQEKESKYAEMDSTIDEASDLSEIDSNDDVLMRDGNEEKISDDDISYENDPWAKMLGKPNHRTKAQRKEFAERVRKKMSKRVKELSDKLGVDIEIIETTDELQGKKKTAKGFFDKKTRKVTVIIPNHTSISDVERTVLHEVVAHKGLRKLFGEHFDKFLDNVFNNASKEIRSEIVAMATKNGWDFRTATEEYLAGLAERTNFEEAHNQSWFSKIKDLFLEMLHDLGFEFSGVTLTDNELRYILWRSYENLKEPGRYRSILGEAADVSKQYELKVGNYQEVEAESGQVAEDFLYRDGNPEIHERTRARDRYERRVKRGMYQTQEALQDSMLGLREAMESILGKKTKIEEVEGFENAYLGENRLSSVNKAEADAFAQTLFKPMFDEVAKLAHNKAGREELTDYMMAKHGLERNRVIAEKYANEAIAAGSNLSFTQLFNDYRKTDYAGLTALTGLEEVADAEYEAQQMVDEYEAAQETADLWEKVNAVSKATLQKSYESGMMDKKTFDKISAMYEFYIPLRGFDEKTSAEAYAYLSHKQSAFNAPIKTAQGRKSKADDPFANLESMAESAIMQGNRNKLVKQRFLNFALNHPSDLVSVSDLWLEHDSVTDEWKPVFADNININDTPDEVEQKMLEFEQKMQGLAEQNPDQYKRGRDAVDVPYRVVESRDLRQHQVVVKRGGRDYVITINGNPRTAQALNGQTNPDNDTSGAIGAILRAGETVNRQLSAFYTTRNPDFIVSNFMRDMLYTNTMAWIKESPNYALRFHRNFGKANPVVLKRLLTKLRKNELDMNDKTEAMFYQFMMNGGETGYANIRDIEQHKNDIKKELKKANGKLGLSRALDLLGERFDELNRAVENCARFAAFMTSREMGRTIDRAIYDAKEISVNFNKKGSGAKFYDEAGQTKAGNASALVSGLGRSGFVFWNAAIQGTTNFGRQLKRHPAKAFTGAAAMFLLGALVASLGGDDDDDSKNAYYNLPEYVRRSNILFRIGDHWISIPLPIEFRAIYGMGELMTSTLSGKEHLTGGEIAEAIAGQATQILPIDFLEGGGGLNAFMPSAVKPLWEAYVVEKGWTGMPLYKDTPYNKEMPEWTKAYQSSNKYIVGLTNVLNEVTGGDPYTKGSIDINPAKVEYMLNGYFGGVFGTIDKLSKTGETITGTRDYDPRNILLMNRLVKAGDERTEYRAVNNEYFRLKEEHDRLKARLKNYESDTDNGIFDYAEKIDFLFNSPDYERYEIFEDYRKDIDALYNELKEIIDDEDRKEIEAELNEVKKELIDEVNLTRKRK